MIDDKEIVLLVDDVSSNLEILDEILSPKYIIKIAKNGKRALEIAERIQPDIILLDIMMPEMDGYEVCRRLKMNSNTSKIPVIFVTARGEVADEVKGLEIGAVDFITKPVKAPIVLARVQTHIRLYKQSKEIEKHERLRTEFFANISHELRTPVNVILSTLQLINLKTNTLNENYWSKEKYKNHTAIMKQNCYRLVRLINNLIDVTKIDSGYLDINLVNTNIVAVVEDITLSISEYIENKGLSLLFDTEVEEKILACDPDKIERIILNLISNAVKFTESEGSIIVNIFDKGENLIISIKDTGIGISEEKQKIIFDRFVQVDKSLTRKREGSGIGLSLVKSLVELHNGTITLKSELNKGSEFIINMPIYLVEESEETVNTNDYLIQGNVEKINIEFSDIYL